MTDCIKYIIDFLLGDTLSADHSNTYIGYTDCSEEFHKYKLVIIPSGFFDENCYGKPHSMPELPLKTIEDIPLLFGVPEIIRQDNRIILKADIIASAYFLLSRYEEFACRQIRDAHGRFPGKESLPYRAGFIHRPVVDEYGRLLRKLLREVKINLPEPDKKINKIYLTVDIDVPFLFRGMKGLLRGLLSSKYRNTALKTFFGHITNDPAYTFPSIIEQNKKLKESDASSVENIYFFKSQGKSPQDKPVYNLFSKDIQQIFSLCEKENITVGLHASYYSGIHPEVIIKEKENLEKASSRTITCNRHHFLSCREPEDFCRLSEAGITDDFTMGYADVSGFRLGTCRPVSYINPVDRKVYPLTLHSLTVMECTLDRKEYMNFQYDEALLYCKNLIDKIAEFNGEVTLLWHNTSFIESPDNWQPKLYQALTDILYEKTNHCFRNQ